MEGLFLLLGLGLLSVPVMAIAALVRSGSVRRDLEDRYGEQQSAIGDLRGDVANLKRALAEVKAKLAAAEEAPHAAVMDARKTAPAAVAATVHVESPERPATQTAVPPAATAPVVAKATPPVPAPLPPVAIPEPVVPAEAAKVEAFTLAAPMQEQAKPAATTRETIGPPVPAATQIPAPIAAVPAANTSRAAKFPAAAPVSMPPAPRPQQTPRAVPAPQFGRFQEAAAPRQSLRDWLRDRIPLEEVLGMNLFAKIGIVLLVLGFALLGEWRLLPWARRASGVALRGLGQSCWAAALARKEGTLPPHRTHRDRRWMGALAFFTTYAMYHVPAMQVMRSKTLNCVLMLAVAAGIVVHTLR